MANSATKSNKELKRLQKYTKQDDVTMQASTIKRMTRMRSIKQQQDTAENLRKAQTVRIKQCKLLKPELSILKSKMSNSLKMKNIDDSVVLPIVADTTTRVDDILEATDVSGNVDFYESKDIMIDSDTKILKASQDLKQKRQIEPTPSYQIDHDKHGEGRQLRNRNTKDQLQQQYIRNSIKFERENQKMNEIDEIRDLLRKKKMKCIKYNNSLVVEYQSSMSFDAFITLEDDQTIVITNKHNCEEKKLILEPDRHTLAQKRKRHYEEELKSIIKIKEGLQSVVINQIDSKVVENQGDLDHFSDCFENEILLDELKDKKFKLKQSASSFNFRDVTGIIYGGQSTRFWVHRKHLNAMAPIETPPFFAWECLTIVLYNREVDLVIADETQMINLLKLLVWEIRTVDGNLNSADGICKALYEQAYKHFQKSKNVQEIGNKDKIKIMKKIDEQVMRKAIMKYKIIRIRIKISYYAFAKNMTVKELFISKLIESYQFFYKIPQILQEEFQFCLQNGVFYFYKFLIKMRFQQGGISKEEYEDFIETNKAKEVKKEEEEQIIEVTKNGLKTQKTVNHLQNAIKSNKISIMSEKHKCFDIFQYAEVDGVKLYQEQTYQQLYKYKIKRNNRLRELFQIEIIIRLRMADGYFYLLLQQRMMQVVHELFLLELEQGESVLIHKYLRQDRLPYSFRFYDHIMRYGAIYIDPEKKQHFHTLQNQCISQLRANDINRHVQKLLGVGEFNKNLSQKHELVNNQKRNELYLPDSEHTRELQRSNYLVVNNDIEKLKKIYKLLESKQWRDIEKEINMRFCLDHEVNKQRNKFLIFKCAFAVKMLNLERNGKQLELMEKIKSWLEDDIEKIYKIFKNTDLMQELIDKKNKNSINKLNNFRKQEILFDYLLHVAQENIVVKQHRKRAEYLDELKEKTHYKLPYEVRNNYTETHIETSMAYFESTKSEENFMILMKNLVKQNERILKKQAMKQEVLSMKKVQSRKSVRSSQNKEK